MWRREKLGVQCQGGKILRNVKAEQGGQTLEMKWISFQDKQRNDGFLCEKISGRVEQFRSC